MSACRWSSTICRRCCGMPSSAGPCPTCGLAPISVARSCTTRYGNRAWLRQLDHPITREMEDTVLRTIARLDGTPFPSVARLAWRWVSGRVPVVKRGAREGELETAYCAEVVAVTYQAMGLLPGGRRPGWYDPGRFWSGDDLDLSAGSRLGAEIAVQIPANTRVAAGVSTANDDGPRTGVED